MSNQELSVKKRNGLIQPLMLDKLHLMVEEACRGLSGVSASLVEMNSGIQFYDGITTDEIQKILIKSASDLISLDAPNYQYVAARLLLFSIRKQVYGGSEMPHLYNHIRDCVDLGVYDDYVLNEYSMEDLNQVNSFIDHGRDYLLTYAAIQQIVDKYLVQDRTTGGLYESPQFMYIMVPLTKFAKYPKEKRLSYVRKYYDAVSKHKINNPTPIMGGLRTPLRQFASCVLVDIDDTKGSIAHSNTAIFEYTTQRAGIGINVGRIRGINSKIRNGEVIHTGLIPFLKMFESTVRSCTQNGIRGGNATVHVPIWHQEIEDVIVLKNNKGSEDNRVRKVDYSIQLSKIFYERFISDGDITLFSPHNVPGLYDKFGLEGFDELYVMYENDQSIPKKKVGAQELIINLLKERAETGRIYIMNIDHCNSHSSYLEQISMSNLCQEITEPTNPLQHIDDDNDAEIATCILSAINVGKLNSLDELEELCDLVVRGLDALIDYQDYPVKAAENFTKRRRSLGIGFTGLAHYLAKLGFSYESQEAWDAVHRLTEAFQYYLLVASNNLAKEVGPCEYYDRTKYSKGILPIDTYKKELDAVSSVPLQYDWESLRADILAYGLRNSTISSQMPVESTSLTTNSTNGIEPPRDFLSVKKSKKGVLKQIVPQYQKLKNNYTLLWEMSNNRGYLNVVGVQQKFLDQGISANTRYVPENYPNNEVPISEIAGDVIYFYSIGGKNLYYHNTNDGKTSDTVNDNQEDLQKIVDDIINSGDDICESCSV